MLYRIYDRYGRPTPHYLLLTEDEVGRLNRHEDVFRCASDTTDPIRSLSGSVVSFKRVHFDDILVGIKHMEGNLDEYLSLYQSRLYAD